MEYLRTFGKLVSSREVGKKPLKSLNECPSSELLLTLPILMAQESLETYPPNQMAQALHAASLLNLLSPSSKSKFGATTLWLVKGSARGSPKSSWNQAGFKQPKGDVWPARGIYKNTDLRGKT